MSGKLVQKTQLYQGSTIAYFDTRKLYSGDYLIKIFNHKESTTKKISLIK